MQHRDIWRAAALLVRQQGGHAEWTAAQNADAMLARGDYRGSMVWVAVGRAIRTLRQRIFRQPVQSGVLRNRLRD